MENSEDKSQIISNTSFVMKTQSGCHQRTNNATNESSGIFRTQNDLPSTLPMLSQRVNSFSRTPSNDSSAPNIRNSAFASTNKHYTIGRASAYVPALNAMESPKKRTAIPIFRRACIELKYRRFSTTLFLSVLAALFIMACTHYLVKKTNNLQEKKTISPAQVTYKKKPYTPRVTSIQIETKQDEPQQLKLLKWENIKPIKKEIDDTEIENSPLHVEYIANSDDASGGEVASGWNKDCVHKKSWQSTFYPTCNTMHELDMVSIPENRKNEMEVTNEIDLISMEGSWRSVWKLKILPKYGMDSLHDDTYVLKMLKIDRDYNTIAYEHNRVDSIAMERLSASPHVISEYSFCGNSVVTDFAQGAKSLFKHKDLTSMDRLYLVRDLLEGLAHIHGIDYPAGDNSTLVHNDINPANIVQVDSTLKFNDFNIGVLQRWNHVKNTECSYPVIYENIHWRSPEEIFDKDNVSSKTDVYSLGNLIFNIMTTREPWNHLEPGGPPEESEIMERKKVGGLPFTPESFIESEDPAVQTIYLAMLSCFTFDYRKRKSAKEITNMVQESIDMIKKNKLVTKDELRQIFKL